jgi:DNA processing protein
VDVDTALSCLGALAAAGFVERSERGWRLGQPQKESAATLGGENE